MAQWAAWSTAPASPWPPWTSSTSPVDRPPTSWTWAVAPAPSRRRNPSASAFRILLSDRHVKAVLINIFGGILRCDTLASGVVGAARDLNIQVPIVVRMEGTNVELGRQILLDSGLNFTVGADMLDAAKKVVKLAAR